MGKRLNIELLRNGLPLALVGLAVAFVYAEETEDQNAAKIDPMTQEGQRAIEEAHIGRKHVPSPLIFPSQEIPVRFSHKLHMKEDLTCVECHDGDTMTGPGITKSVRS